MDDTKVTNTSSIMDYFQREKSLVAAENDGENEEEKTAIVILDCAQSKRTGNDGGKMADSENSCSRQSGPNKKEQNEKKSKWNFSWKGKIKKSKPVDNCHDDDSDFETNNESTNASSKPRNLEKSVAGTKSKSKKASRVKERARNPSTKVRDTKRNDKISDSANVNCDSKTCGKVSDMASPATSESQETSLLAEFQSDSISIRNVTQSSCDDESGKNVDVRFDKVDLRIQTEGSCESTTVSQLSRVPESGDCVLELRTDSVCKQNVTEESINENTTKKFETSAGEISVERCNDTNSEGISQGKENINIKEGVKTTGLCNSSETSNSRTETPKKSYFDILMQSSKAKAGAKQVSSEVGDQARHDDSDNNCCEKTTKGNKIEDSPTKNDKKGKARKPRRKKVSGCKEDAKRTVNETDGNESANNATEGKTVRKSARRTRSLHPAETLCVSDPTEEMNIECSKDKVEFKPSTRTRGSRTATSRRIESMEKNFEPVSCEKLPGPEENAEKMALVEEKEEDFAPSRSIDIEAECETKVAHSSQRGDEVKGVNEDCGDNVSTKQKRKSKRLRASCILDSDEEQSTESPKETKPSVLETSKTENHSKKVSGPIASIFLPGAWRRAKAKLEEVERLEATKDVVEIGENSSSLQASDLPEQNGDNLSNVNSGENSISNNDSALSMAAFFSMFQKPTPKPATIVVKLIEAPFPKISHVRQQGDEEKDAKWNLAMVRNRFVKEEYFFMPHSNRCIAHQDLPWFKQISVSSSEGATTADSKHIQLNVSLEMDKSQKQNIISYLKTVYQGVPLKKLFKRCQHQLELCEKSLRESEFAGPLAIGKGNFRKSHGTAAAVSTTQLSSTSTKVSEKNESFTKISRKKSTNIIEAKAEKKKKSPLLLAFQNQENAPNRRRKTVAKAQSKKEESVVITESKKEESAVKIQSNEFGGKTQLKKKESVLGTNSKKDKVKKTSIMDFMGIQSKQAENVPENKPSAKSKRGKKTGRKITDTVEVLQIEDSDGLDKATGDCKKRMRESECDVASVTAEENAEPVVKKVKLLNDAQDFKKPRRGRKRKVRSAEGRDSAGVVEVKDDRNESCGKSAKCQKISSDDDFVKLPSRRSQGKCKVNAVTNDVVEDASGTDAKCLRKSRRLQQKCAAEEVDNQMEAKIPVTDVETSVGKNDNDVVEVNVVEKDGIKQDDQIQKNEEDIKVVEDSTTKTDHNTGVTHQACDKKIALQISSNEENGNAKTGSALSSVLWSECFKPRNSSEILGNTNAGVRLKNWLSEWKTLRERKLEALKRHEEKKKRRLAAKKGAKEASSKWWYDDDDSDFCSSDDSSDENFCEDEIVCNTMLVSGRVGCGKTSAVYACAEELGFKVIEVNASTKRGGKYILSELQEATQSHQVSTKRNLLQGQSSLFPQANSNTGDPGEKNDKMKEEAKKGKKLSKRGRPKKKEQLSKETQLQGPMSLILLDEVDVLFEEDKGFWVSVNTLRQNSKRPIVMTALDPSTVDIDGQFEHILLKSPSLKLYAAYLQTVCLTKNVFVNPSDMRALSWLHYADIRRLLLSIQFWVDSNAGACDEHGVAVRNDLGTSAHILSIDETASASSKDSGTAADGTVTSMELDKESKLPKNPCRVDTSTNCEVEIISLDPCSTPKAFTSRENDNTSAADISKKSMIDSIEHKEDCDLAKLGCGRDSGLPNLEATNKQQFVIGENESAKLSEANIEDKVISTKAHKVSHGLDNQDSCQEPSNELLRIERDVTLEHTRIEMHDLCLESLLGLRNLNSDTGGVLETLKSKNSFREKCVVTSHCQDLNMDIVYCNLETLFPCVFGLADTIADNPIKTHSVKGSDHSKKSDVCESTFSECQKDDAQMKEGLPIRNESKITDQRKILEKDLISKKLVGISLKSLESFYEDMSFMDSELGCDDTGTSEERFESWSAKISPGLKDSVGKRPPCRTTWKTRNSKNELRGALEVASLENSHKRFHEICNRRGVPVVEFLKNSKSMCCQDAGMGDFDIIDSCANSKLLTNSAERLVIDKTITGNAPDDKYCLSVTTSTENLSSKTMKRQHDFTSVSSHLPEFNYLNRGSIILDYLPTLHTICKAESLRKAARVKRRFYHYLDSIGLHIPSSAVQSLTENSYFN